MENELTRDQVDALPGGTILEFGASWCGICKATRSLIDEALLRRPSVRHIWIEDGKGKRLGRSFRVKLWPTLIVLQNGVEVGRVVRPCAKEDVETLLGALGNQPQKHIP